MPVDQFRWGHRFNVLEFVVGAGSMLVADGDDHKRRRSSVQAAFSRKRLNGWVPMIVERTDAAVDALVAELPPDGAVVDLYRVGRGLVLEIVVRALFGERLAGRADRARRPVPGAAGLPRGPGALAAAPPVPAAPGGPGSGPTSTRSTPSSTSRSPRSGPSRAATPSTCSRRSSSTARSPMPRSATRSAPSWARASTRPRRRCRGCSGAAPLTPGLWDRLRAEADEVYGPLSSAAGRRRVDPRPPRPRQPGDARDDPAAPRRCGGATRSGGRRRRRRPPHPEGHAGAAVGPPRRPRPGGLGGARCASTPTASSTRPRSARRSPTSPGCPSAAAPATASASPSPRWSSP